MLSVIIPTIIANLATTGCALLLVRRGPSRRLKLLTLTVGLMSLAQTASCLQNQGILTAAAPQLAQLYQMVAALLSMVSIVLLGREAFDRNVTDRKLRLAEHEIPIPAVKPPAGLQREFAPMGLPKLVRPAPRKEDGKASAGSKAPTNRAELHLASMRASSDLLLMLSAVSADPSPKPAAVEASEIVNCPKCREIAREMASAWLEFHLNLEIKSGGQIDPRVQNAGRRVMQVLESKRLHELESCHELPLLTEPQLPKLAVETRVVEMEPVAMRR